MKVLVIHNLYRISGGEDLSTEAEITLLKCNGVEVDTYYVDNSDIDTKKKLSLAVNSIWSRHYYKEILKKIEKGKYDIVHVHNYFPLLSPSILHACKKAKTKVVMSVHNYRLICPNAQMYVNGNICKECVGKVVPVQAILKKCYRKSAIISSAVVGMLAFHNFLDTWKNKVDGYICVSQFVKSQLVLGGFADEKLYVKYNFVTTDIEPNFDSGQYYIYAGRLSEEKGIDILLKCFKNSNRELIIVGNGPLKETVEKYAKENPNIVYLGKRPLNEIYTLMAKAKALIFPSKWLEPFGRTIVEAFAHGTPVIASAMGGITELITDSYNGFLFNPNDQEGLTRAIAQLENLDSNRTIRMNTYKSYQKNYLPAMNFDQMMSIYRKVLSVV
jgi:glycosyltransferase involved in cell wall biosynthesis